MLGTTRCLVVVAMATAACSSDDGGMTVDAGDPDVAAIDAPRGSCEVGEVESQGDWVDWDSTDQSFLGIFEATIAEGANSTTTAPNGRAIICLAAGADHRLDFSHPSYLPMTAALPAADLGANYSVHGLTPARADELFATELSLTRDVAAAQVLIELPAGAAASLDTISAGEFAVPSAAYTFFANVPVGTGTTTLTVTPPNGQTCSAIGSLDLAAGVTSFASVVCN